VPDEHRRRCLLGHGVSLTNTDDHDDVKVHQTVRAREIITATVRAHADDDQWVGPRFGVGGWEKRF
jgi:hypothetical protein